MQLNKLMEKGSLKSLCLAYEKHILKGEWLLENLEKKKLLFQGVGKYPDHLVEVVPGIGN